MACENITYEMAKHSNPRIRPLDGFCLQALIHSTMPAQISPCIYYRVSIACCAVFYNLHLLGHKDAALPCRMLLLASPF